MAFNGYFVKIKEKTAGQGDYTFPNSYISFESPKPIRGVQDMDSYRDGDGKLHRNVLEHNVAKIEFQTRPITNRDYNAIMGEISARYTNSAERKMKAQLYLPELDTYTDWIDVYLPDPEITIISIVDNNTLRYAPIRFACIEY